MVLVLIACVAPLVRNTHIRLTFIGNNMDTLQQIETRAFLELIEVMKKLEIDLGIANHQLEMARDRIAQLESEVYGGTTQ